MEIDLEIVKWLLDISKYLITAMLLTTAFSDMSNPWIVMGVILSALITLWLGVMLLKRGESKKNKNVKNKNRK